ncbi:Pre-mRNA-processing factor 17 [Cryptotermes secundus]|uniref:Pre-mRNA-processing factor 17 n=1 Tax=Cryptotermes secundus TaxID=105785 RepID=A0A2J7R200_9NEOP|nr:pre-mRNA-processing factor 17 [Cryptotermes secundus]XP_023706482.1 pre-mRNA-processing factor 17 [Cryptotermes secundus]PNF34865.1 Pre-mRNA-processing factor 17 [Cryptotermes secundus]PNF34866.1 Pre-mRNA-processing factor 17 [Cryptotermes secundus]
MLHLQQYGSSDEEGNSENREDFEDITSHLKPLGYGKSITSIQNKMQVCSAPDVVPTSAVESLRHIDSTTKEVMFNPKYEELFAPEIGPENPFQTRQQRAHKNMLSGFVEQTHINDFQFENQRRTFNSYGYALDPTVGVAPEEATQFIGATEAAKEAEGKTVFESTKERKSDKRKRIKNDNPSDIEGFLGPWGGYVDEKRVMKPNEEEAAELEEILAKRQKRGKQVDDKPLEEKTVLHIRDVVDYQGRSFLHAPQDVGVNLRSDSPPERCFLPKSHIHTWQGHTKGISTVRWFPKTAHLLLSCSMDCRVKLWEVYNERRCIRTYYGHQQAVRDICFSNAGTQFLSAAYDRYIKLWDTETGQCMSRFTSRKIPYCVKFHPEEDKQHFFVAGTSDKKIICWDVRSGEIVQEYDRHLGAVNTITFVDENRRFVTTSDDKSLRVWEWDIPVDMKYIADPTMHSMPAVTPSPNQKWLACQSMDNKIVIFSALNRFKMNRKKTFSGHMVAGYACTLDFSPDMSYLVSGDADGKCYIWDWKTTKLYKKWKAHDSVCIGVLWHPHEPSKLVTAGWDGLIKYWD